MNTKEKEIENVFEKLVLGRFKTLEDLTFYVNKKLDDNIMFNDLRVKEIANKSYYDSDFQDWEIICIIGTDDEDLYDLSIYYAKTRIKEKIITEVGYERV